jgi:hypothetical protein
MPQIIHLHLPANFDGELHLHLGADGSAGQTITVPIDTVGSGIDPALESVLERFERYAGTRLSRELFDILIQLGWEPNAPTVRKEGKVPEAYIRWVRTWPKGSRVVLYQDSQSLSSRAGVAEGEWNYFATTYDTDVLAARAVLTDFMAEVEHHDTTTR